MILHSLGIKVMCRLREFRNFLLRSVNYSGGCVHIQAVWDIIILIRNSVFFVFCIFLVAAQKSTIVRKKAHKTFALKISPPWPL